MSNANGTQQSRPSSTAHALALLDDVAHDAREIFARCSATRYMDEGTIEMLALIEQRSRSALAAAADMARTIATYQALDQMLEGLDLGGGKP